MRISHEENTDFSAAQMFAIVSDIGLYPKFLPYCTSMQILSHNPSSNQIIARMGIGYGVIQEKFDCFVALDASKHLIEVEYISGRLSDLRVLWRFEDIDKNCGRCFFELNYDTISFFRKKLLDILVPHLFGSFIHAFKRRASDIYNKKLSC